MRLSVIFGLLLSLMGCDPNVEIENIAADNLLSITCFISPQDSIFKAYVFRANRIGSTVKEDSAAVKDALVTISDGNKFDTLFLTFDVHPISRVRIYKYSGKRRNVSVKDNLTYSLVVQTPSGEKVSAMCTIPPEPGAPAVSGVKENDDFRFSITWSNPFIYKYFILILDAVGSYDNPYPGGSGKIDLQPSLLEGIKFPSDKQVLNNSYEAVVPFAFLASNPALKVSIRNIDDGLFKYFKTYQRYQQWDDNNSGNLFPSFQEIPLIYSNINGGVGIFGGYNSSSIEIKL